MIFATLLGRLRLLPMLARSEDGQAMVEYALLISLIATVCFGAVQLFGLGVSSLFSKIYAVVP
jgi:Flp pilus assembly pilin Flp